jgi:hypothetical protein
MIAVAVVAMAVGLRLPWSRNAIVGSDGGVDVLFGRDGLATATLVMLAAVPVVLLACLWRRRGSAAVGVVAAAALIVALVAHGRRISDQQANAVGATATGEMFEDWATSTVGAGYVLWLVAAGLLLVVTGADLVVTWRAGQVPSTQPAKRATLPTTSSS